jgi:hypothetical protein
MRGSRSMNTSIHLSAEIQWSEQGAMVACAIRMRIADSQVPVLVRTGTSTSTGTVPVP